MKSHARFQSTLSVRRATLEEEMHEKPCKISIHALRKESDTVTMTDTITIHISIHALRKESDANWTCGADT